MRPGSPICLLALLYYLILIYPTRGMPVVQTPSRCRSAPPQTSIELVTSFVFTTLPGSVAVEIVVEIEDAIPTFTPTTNPVDTGPGPTALDATEAASDLTGFFPAFPAPKTYPVTFIQTADTTPILTGPPRQPTTLLMEMTSTTPFTEVAPPTTGPGHPQPTTQPTGAAALVSSSESDSADAARGEIIGGVCGGLFLVFIGCAICRFEWRRRQRMYGRPFISDSSRSSSFATSYAGKSQMSNVLLKTYVEPYIVPALNVRDKFILKASKVDEAATRMKSRPKNEAITEDPSGRMLAVSNPDTPPDYDDVGVS